MIVRLIVATIVGGIVSFGAGFLIYGLLLGPTLIAPNVHVYTNEYGNLMKNPPSMIPLILANLTFPFLIALIFEVWANIRTLATGAMAGAIIFFLVTLYNGFSFFAFFTLYKNFTPMLANLAGSIVLGALVGGVIGLVLGWMKKDWFAVYTRRVDTYPRQYLYRRVVRAKLFIDAQFSSAIDLDNIADEACFSKFHFVRLFRSIYGQTPHQYLTEVRVRRAKILLAEGSTVESVCYAVGFDSISSFTGLFRRRVGETPAAFQRRELAKQDDIAARPSKFVPNCFIEKRGWKE